MAEGSMVVAAMLAFHILLPAEGISGDFFMHLDWMLLEFVEDIGRKLLLRDRYTSSLPEPHAISA